MIQQKTRKNGNHDSQLIAMIHPSLLLVADRAKSAAGDPKNRKRKRKGRKKVTTW